MTMPAASKLLIIEDDQMLAAALAEQLDLQGEFTSTVVASAADGLAALRQGRHQEGFKAILISADLPLMDGQSLRAALKDLKAAQGGHGPLLLLTKPGLDAEPFMDHEQGASDYVVKPFRLSVLLTRLRAQMRRAALQDATAVPFGPYTFSPGSKTLALSKGGQTLELTEKEVAILKCLHAAKGEMVTRKALLAHVWGYGREVNTHTLETHIYRLRQKIDGQADAPSLITTVPGGYALTF